MHCATSQTVAAFKRSYYSSNWFKHISVSVDPILMFGDWIRLSDLDPKLHGNFAEKNSWMPEDSYESREGTVRTDLC